MSSLNKRNGAPVLVAKTNAPTQSPFLRRDDVARKKLSQFLVRLQIVSDTRAARRESLAAKNRRDS